MDKIQGFCFLGGRLVDYTGADIYLNKNGLRFVNEGASHGDVLAELLKQPQRAMWVITDSQSKKGLSLENKLADGAVKKFDSLRQVAAFIGCPAETLEETVTRYNDFVLKGVDKDFGKKVMLQTISYPPFYVGQERVGVHYCCGGLKFNEKAQVLNTSEEPIAGLYVAGEASGGVHGKDRLGGIGLTDAWYSAELQDEKRRSLKGRPSMLNFSTFRREATAFKSLMLLRILSRRAIKYRLTVCSKLLPNFNSWLNYESGQGRTVFGAVVVAAGVGSRMGTGSPKQYELIGSKTMLERSVQVLLDEPRIKELVVVISPAT